MYKCTSCGKEFFFEGQLKRHVLFNHQQAEQPSSLFAEIERHVSSVIEEVPLSIRRTRPHITATPYADYPTLESLREESPDTEDLSREWYGDISCLPARVFNSREDYIISSTAGQITPPTWIVNPSSW